MAGWMLHCRGVSLRDVEGPLTPDRIDDLVLGRQVYHLTEVVVLRDGGDHAVVRVATEGRGVLHEVVDVEVLAGPKETQVVEDDRVDVFNPAHMARLTRDRDAGAVVVHGRYGYTGVALPTEVVDVAVVDLVPPEEPRLVAMAEELLDADPPRTPIALSPVRVDAEEAGRDATEPVLFPCRGSARGPLFLDEGPDLDEDEAAKATVVGCDQSARIFMGLYGTRPELRDVCPLSHAPEGPAIARCCQVEDVVVKDGTVVVPWGASHAQVRKALRIAAEQEQRRGDGGSGRADPEPG